MTVSTVMATSASPIMRSRRSDRPWRLVMRTPRYSRDRHRTPRTDAETAKRTLAPNTVFPFTAIRQIARHRACLPVPVGGRGPPRVESRTPKVPRPTHELGIPGLAIRGRSRDSGVSAHHTPIPFLRGGWCRVSDPHGRVCWRLIDRRLVDDVQEAEPANVVPIQVPTAIPAAAAGAPPYSAPIIAPTRVRTERTMPTDRISRPAPMARSPTDGPAAAIIPTDTRVYGSITSRVAAQVSPSRATPIGSAGPGRRPDREDAAARLAEKTTAAPRSRRRDCPARRTASGRATRRSPGTAR